MHQSRMCSITVTRSGTPHRTMLQNSAALAPLPFFGPEKSLISACRTGLDTCASINAILASAGGRRRSHCRPPPLPKARANFRLRRWHGAPAPRPPIVAVLFLVIRVVRAPHTSAFQDIRLLRGSGMRPGIVHSLSPAQGIVRPYCSSGRGVSSSCWGSTTCGARLGGGCLYKFGGLDRPQ